MRHDKNDVGPVRWWSNSVPPEPLPEPQTEEDITAFEKALKEMGKLQD